MSLTALLSPLLASCSLLARPIDPPPPFAAQPQPARPPAPAYLPRVDAAPAPDLAIEGQVGGATWAVAARDDVAFVGVGPRIIAYDLTPTDRAEAPRELARSAVLGRTVRDLLLDGDKLYAAIGGAGVSAFDVADPARIAPITTQALEGEAGSLALDGGRLYVTLGKRGVAVLDANDRRLPELGRWLAPMDGTSPAKVFDIAIDGPLAYAAVDTHGLLVLDVNSPDHIAILGEDAAHGEARRVTLVGRTAWVAADNGEVHVYDLRDPVKPRSFAQPDERFVRGDEAVAGFAVDEHRIAISGGPLEIWDVADPFAPRQLGTGTDGVYGRHAEDGGDGVVFAGGRLVVAGGATGEVVILDAGDRSAPRQTARLGGMENVWRSALLGGPDGRTLFSGANRFDVVRPANPQIVAVGTMRWLASAMGRGVGQAAVVDGPTAYVAGGFDDEQVIAYDIADPGAPRRVGAIDDRAAVLDWGGLRRSGWNVYTMAKVDDRLILAAYDAFAVVDATDPAAMRLLSVRGVQVLDAIHAPSPAPAFTFVSVGLAEDGRTAVGVDAGAYSDVTIAGWGGIQAIDLSNPAQPRFGPHLQTQFEQNAVVIHGHHAFVAAGKGGLRVYDIADVDAVREVGVWDEGDEKAVAIEMAWPQVLMARSKRLDLIDVRDPGHPARIASVGVPGVVKALTLYRGRAWVLTEDAGLVGYRFR